MRKNVFEAKQKPQQPHAREADNPLVEPYLDELRSCRRGQDADFPVVPVIRGTDRVWRFFGSTPREEQAHPARLLPEHVEPLEDFIVPVPRNMAKRFRDRASDLGMAPSELLLALIDAALS